MSNTLTMGMKDIEILKDKEAILEEVSKICDVEPEMVVILKNMVKNILKIRQDTKITSRVLDVNINYNDYTKKEKETYAKRFKNEDEKWDDRAFM